VIRPLRFVHGYLRNQPPVAGPRVTIPTAAGEVAGTLYMPAGRGPFPGWVILHGLSVHGHQHPTLLRFVAAMVRSGSAVLVPEIASWRRLRIAAAESHEILVQAVNVLTADPRIRDDAVGLVGFSFGSTQALAASADTRIAGRVRTCVGFGGYADLRRTMRYFVDGRHEWEGRLLQGTPDPYGRWVATLNYLTRVPGLEGMERVEAGLERLARTSGERLAVLDSDTYRAINAEIRSGLRGEELRVWELVAPRDEQEVVRDPAGLELAGEIAETALREEPLIDPAHAFPRLACRVVLSHGVDDRLIPFSETLRLRDRLPAHLSVTTRLTGLFVHSERAVLPAIGFLREGVGFLRLLRAALR
jgi:pimeloyl-ACP methyl ester carboxylesterase